MKIRNICKKSLDKETCKVARLLFSPVNDLGINKTIYVFKVRVKSLANIACAQCGFFVCFLDFTYISYNDYNYILVTKRDKDLLVFQ